MDKIIPNLYDNLNLTTLPKIIKDEFYKMGFWYDKELFIKPFHYIFTFKLENESLTFYAHTEKSSFTDKLIKENRLLNESYELITSYYQYQNEYIIEYGRGFYNGYIDYTKELKNKDNLIFETDNKQTAYKIFSKVIQKTGFKKSDGFPISFIPIQDIEKITAKFKKDVNYYYLTKQSFKDVGYQVGQKYKAWELILHNPTLFEDIFKEQLSKPEPKEELIIETPKLNLKNIPNFTLQQRYNLFEQLGFDSIIHQLDTEKQGAKHKLLALILGISPDNAKHLLNGTYKEFTIEQQEEVEEFLHRNKIKI